MRIRRNKLTKKQAPNLVRSLNAFCSESQLNQDPNLFTTNTLKHIKKIMSGKCVTDQLWTLDNDKDLGFCLTRFENDSDGSRAFTAYQLYLPPSMRGWLITRRMQNVLRAFARKHKASRFLIMSSRLDKIKAYQRGIGNRFKVKAVIFSDELN